ncbi:hypothetical protein [Campylobacter canadensis]|uniref:hypothetical protein n=1 Tax=Campylobacter canadensis TaxID=449520 RepID=UPI001CCBB669|nr:hypothetical protein [Campylobacter canadensis]MBZ8002392.1 hypothetical protein [Campylobacter canadensis]
MKKILLYFSITIVCFGATPWGFLTNTQCYIIDEITKKASKKLYALFSDFRKHHLTERNKTIANSLDEYKNYTALTTLLSKKNNILQENINIELFRKKNNLQKAIDIKKNISDLELLKAQLKLEINELYILETKNDKR